MSKFSLVYNKYRLGVSKGDFLKSNKLLTAICISSLMASSAFGAFTGDTGAQAVGNEIAIGNNAKANLSDTNVDEVGIAIGANTRANQAQGIAIGGATRANEGATAIGSQSIAIGGNTTAKGYGAIAIGGDDTSAPNTNNNFGATNGGLAPNNNTTYRPTAAVGLGSVALGQHAQSLGNTSLAIGVGATAGTANGGTPANGTPTGGSNAVAIGTTAKATNDNSIAIGSNSVANRSTGDGYVPEVNGVKQTGTISDTKKGDLGVVSVGSDTGTRQIINVAAGEKDSDAVNVAQLKAVVTAVDTNAKNITKNTESITNLTNKVDQNTQNITKNTQSIDNINNTLNTITAGGTVNSQQITNISNKVDNLNTKVDNLSKQIDENKDKASAGIASAMAIGNLPQATIPGKGMMAIGAGYYDGQSGLALGVSKMSDNGKWVFKASTSLDTQSSLGASASVGFHF